MRNECDHLTATPGLPDSLLKSEFINIGPHRIRISEEELYICMAAILYRTIRHLKLTLKADLIHKQTKSTLLSFVPECELSRHFEETQSQATKH